MRVRTSTLVTLAVGVSMAAALACTGPAATTAPSATATATPTASATPTPSPTPSPEKEWELDGIRVRGTSVLVRLQVYAGIDVRATLDGRLPDLVNAFGPVIEHVFHNVAAGSHTVRVSDVVGFEQTDEVVVAVPTTTPGGPPAWLNTLITKLGREPVANPPVSIARFDYHGQTVYFVPQRCCDIMSTLYNAAGEIIGHPDGGITGEGDGRASDFFDERSNKRPVWEDRRKHDPGQVQVLAPVESLEVLILESFPPQYNVAVVSGLPNGCVSFAGYRLERNGKAIRIELVNWKPADPAMMCTMVYGTVETTIGLGSDFVSGETYTVSANDLTESFVAQ